MRVSVAGLACIRRVGTAGPEYLAQWSQKWGMFSLVGGHVEAGETFRECCVREVEEELLLTPGKDFAVANRPFKEGVEYVAMSGGAKVETLYKVELYVVEFLTPEAEAQASAMPENRWLTPAEIAAGVTADGKPISAQVKTVFGLCGVMSDGPLN